MEITHGYLFSNGVEEFAAQLNAADADHHADVRGLDDNGGDPDGPAWIVWNLTPAEEHIAVGCGGQRIAGYVVEYSAKAMNEVMDQFLSGEDWSGVGCADEAFFTNKRDAELSQRVYNAMCEDDDLETIAARVA